MKNPISGIKDRAHSLRDGISQNGHSFLYTLIISMTLVMVCSVAWGIKSCTENDYYFNTNEEAIAFYRAHLNGIRKLDACDCNKLCAEINCWTETKDTVMKFLARDSTLTSKSELYIEYQDITDSIKDELSRLAETWRCSFNDVIKIKEGTSPFRDDNEIIEESRKADSLFRSLNEITILPETKERAIEEYRAFLSKTQKEGIYSWNDVTKFIIMEDISFRKLLIHLYELEGEHISDITDATERICREIFVNAKNGKLDKKKVITYMSMRTVRRLLQNSNACVKDIYSRKLKSDAQANAYLWMIIQPFMSIDQLAIVTITPEGRQELKSIADKIPKSTSFAQAFNIDQRALSYLLPQQLLKMYIYSL